MTERDEPQVGLACNLGAMTPEQRERHRALGSSLRGIVREVREQPDGFEFDLPPEAWSTAAEFVALERLCCPFVRFHLAMAEDGGPVLLGLTGREGVKEFLRIELGLPSPPEA
jgi:hypothetical protein